jgi:hypothetical protein
MKPMTFLVLVTCLSVPALPAPAQERPSYDKLSPFDGLRWRGFEPEVKVGRTWYSLVSLNGVPVADIVAFCRKEYAGRWQKRFREDLVEVLSRMGHPPGKAVALDLRDIETDERVLKHEVPMTYEKRQALWQAARDEEERSQPAVPAQLSRLDAETDLKELERLLERRFAYATLHGLKPRAVLDGVRTRLTESMPAGDFGLLIMKALARFGDGHSGIAGSSSLLPPGCLPFIVKPLGEKLVAIAPGGEALLDPDHPYLKALDGLPAAHWFKAATLTEGRTSPHLERRHAARLLHHLAWLRGEMGRPVSDEVEVQLDNGRTTESRRLKLVSRPLPDRNPVDRQCRTLPENIGLLRIPSMESEPEFLSWLNESMVKLAKTRGLVIDVRGNGGGSRAALRTLFPHFMKDGDPPRVINVAAYRLDDGENPATSEGWLEDRWLYPASWPGWSEAERTAIAKVAEKFRPDWTPPPGAFSAWHFMVLERPDSFASPAYDRPVIILMDSGCFSATDVFLGAFKGWRNVTLLGTPSGGGSGRPRSYVLPRSGLRVRLSSMISFLPEGTRYDGRGIAPDVLVEPVLSDLLGRTDTVLETAIKRLQ